MSPSMEKLATTFTTAVGVRGAAAKPGAVRVHSTVAARKINRRRNNGSTRAIGGLDIKYAPKYGIAVGGGHETVALPATGLLAAPGISTESTDILPKE